MENGKFCVIGAGGAGCRVISHLVNEPGADKLKFIAIDTDKNGLAASGLAPENCILAGELWRNGRGTGGSVIDGQRAMSHERKRIEEMLLAAMYAVNVKKRKNRRNLPIKRVCRGVKKLYFF